MDINRMTNDLEAVLERARAGLHEGIAAAQKAVKAADNDKAAAQNALTNLKDQHAEAQSQLDAVMKHLGKASNFAAIDAQTKTAQKELQGLQAEISQATTAIAKLTPQKTECEKQIAAMRLEVQALAEARTQISAEIARLKRMLAA